MKGIFGKPAFEPASPFLETPFAGIYWELEERVGCFLKMVGNFK